MTRTKITRIVKAVDRFNPDSFYYQIYFQWDNNTQKVTFLNQKSLQYWISKGLKKLEVGLEIDVVQVGKNKYQIKWFY